MKTDILITDCDYEGLTKANILKETILKSAKAFEFDERYFLRFEVNDDLIKALFPDEYDVVMLKAIERLKAEGIKNEAN